MSKYYFQQNQANFNLLIQYYYSVGEYVGRHVPRGSSQEENRILIEEMERTEQEYNARLAEDQLLIAELMRYELVANGREEQLIHLDVQQHNINFPNDGPNEYTGQNAGDLLFDIEEVNEEVEDNEQMDF